MLLRKQFENSPVLARVAPFVVFLLLTYGQGKFGEASRYWFYLAKTLVGAWLLFEMRPFVAEMRAAFSWEAVAVGIGVAVTSALLYNYFTSRVRTIVTQYDLLSQEVAILVYTGSEKAHR